MEENHLDLTACATEQGAWRLQNWPDSDPLLEAEGVEENNSL